ncbi:MAG: fibronectin type III domain-containing protein [Candidatus Latescibacteria bacterium]|nr:fibronectin type III domain-containing protein [Candidatus Latescibacterota bacterium]
MHIFLMCLLLTGQFSPPENVRAFDTPNDAGRSITLNWNPCADPDIAGYQVFRSQQGENPVCINTLLPVERQFIDESAMDGMFYTYQIVAFKVVGEDTVLVGSEMSNLVTSKPQWFNTKRINVLIGIVIFFTLILYYISHAKRGKKLFIRRIAGLDAVEEAVGRATEMGKPILYVPGLSSVSDIATIAALNILGEVAKKTAQYETTLLVPNRDPIVYTVAREIVKEAYTSVGRPDVYKADNIFFITDSQFAYAAAVDGIMVREKPATNFFLGMFWAESLILAETGATTGAIQIAGTDSIYQLPFFITACDYTLIGEELYAASAYLSREPLLLGSLVGQDYGKLVIVVTVIIASILLLLSAKFPILNILRFFNVG